MGVQSWKHWGKRRTALYIVSSLYWPWTAIPTEKLACEPRRIFFFSDSARRAPHLTSTEEDTLWTFFIAHRVYIFVKDLRRCTVSEISHFIKQSDISGMCMCLCFSWMEDFHRKKKIVIVLYFLFFIFMIKRDKIRFCILTFKMPEYDGLTYLFVLCSWLCF